MLRSVLVAGLSLVMSTTAARADEDAATRAKEIAKEAERLTAAGDPMAAAARYAEAYALDPRPQYRCNIGVVYHKAAELPRAFLYLQDCVADADALEAQFVAAAAAVLADTEEQLRAGNFGAIDLSLAPDGATARVSTFADHDVILRSRRVWLPFGRHTITATLAGYTPQSIERTVTARAPEPLEVTLEPVALPGAPDDGASPPPPPAGRRSLLAPVTATAATAVIGVGSLLSYVAARSAASSAGELPPGPRYDDKVASARRWRAIAVGGAVVSAGGAVVSVLLWRKAFASERPPVDVAITPSTDGASMWLGGRF